MTKPLALICYGNLMPGSRLPNRLTDLGYRVVHIADAGSLITEAKQHRPMVIILDLALPGVDVCKAIEQLRQTNETSHVPILGYSRPQDRQLQEAARAAGASVVASDSALLPQLPQLLEQILEVE